MEELVGVNGIDHASALCSKLLSGDSNVDALFEAELLDENQHGDKDGAAVGALAGIRERGGLELRHPPQRQSNPTTIPLKTHQQ
jgi:hypothetical protein